MDSRAQIDSRPDTADFIRFQRVIFQRAHSPIPAVPNLAGPFLNGLKCDQCRYIARQVRLIQEHCRTIHGWSNPRTKGRNTAEKARLMPKNPWRSDVPCQRFFPSRRASGWFEVGKAEPNPWLRRVGWAEHLTGFDPHILRHTPSTPFTSRLEPQTIERYTNVWKRVVGYIFRTINLDDSDRPPYKFQQHQTDALIQFQYYLSYTTNTVSEQTEQTESLTKALDRACLDFLVTLLDQQLPHSSYDSVLLSALAVMGIRQDGGWLRPEEYTSIYSAIIKIARMLVVWQSQLEAEDIGPVKTGVFVLVREKVTRFMTLVHEAGLPTPMDWIFDSRTYGFKVCFTTPSSGQLY
ncbi:hypothetical protein QBC43DRAFT_348513 [Cladorrhinum sp. PSN259]|nr:hypothetical protein QBC43DRAFT_348513 [Cladorrhinum sp. PSN259]